MSWATYLFVDLAVISIPLAFSWHRAPRFRDDWRAFWPSCGITLLVFILWDIGFTSIGIWGFNPTYLSGLALIGLPIEEWLFFITIPYACVFTYTVFRNTRLESRRIAPQIVWFLLAGLIVGSALAWGQWYTFSALSYSSLLMGFFVWRRPPWLKTLFVSFLILMLPFIITNGVLTGLEFWNYPPINLAPDSVMPSVVWYNNDHNLGIRLFSIPFDDVFYAFGLMGTNVALFEHFKASGKLGSSRMP